MRSAREVSAEEGSLGHGIGSGQMDEEQAKDRVLRAILDPGFDDMVEVGYDYRDYDDYDYEDRGE